MVEERRVYPPPPPSTPREVPWREVEEIISGLKAVASKLDALISLYAGIPVTPTEIAIPPPTVTPPPTVGASEVVSSIRSLYEWGTATGGSKDRLLDQSKKWEDGMWEGYEIVILSGQGAGQRRIIKTNTTDTITPRSEWNIEPDRTSVYIIRTARATIANKTSFVTGQKNVTTAGVAEQLPDVKIPDGCQLTIIAKPGNSGNIYLGNSKDNAESSTDRFDALEAGVAVSLKITNAKLLWIDADNNGDGVSFIVEQD